MSTRRSAPTTRGVAAAAAVSTALV
ncbi:MAG: hypothetical protein JWN57_2455, partial [Frankiales bacterium]|nr:hypothetical protein [Frankiales bacterium]